MIKRKLDDVIKESAETNTIDKTSKVTDAAEKYSNDQNSYMLTNTELYSNKNIKLILLHYMHDRIIDVDVLDYDINKEREEQWNKQHQKLIKKLRFNLYKFQPPQLMDKIYILAEREHNTVITAACIIRYFKPDDKYVIDVIPVILHKYSRSLYNKLIMRCALGEFKISIVYPRRSGVVINCEGIEIGKFIEVIKLKICNIANPESIQEDTMKVIEIPSNNYKISHQEIVDKYKNEFQDSEGKFIYSSEEDQILDVIDKIKDNIEHENMIKEIVEKLITKVVKKCEKGEKKLSWDMSVIDNEGRTRNNEEVLRNDKAALQIFYRAIKSWDIGLFIEAKNTSKDFKKLVDYFREEINQEFLKQSIKNSYYTHRLNTPNLSDEEKRETENAYRIHVLQRLNGYVFLIKCVPNLLDQIRAEQCSKIKSPVKDELKDLIELLQSKVNGQ